MSKYKLTYFNVKGLGESIRILLSYMDKEFEDVRMEKEDWPPRKKQTLFGKLPTLEIDGKVICESSAICRYLAVEAGLSGKNDWENLQIDMIVGTVMDIHFDIVTFVRENEPKKKEELRMKLLNETIPFYFDKYEERVKTNNYIANNSINFDQVTGPYVVCSIEEGFSQAKNIQEWKYFSPSFGLLSSIYKAVFLARNGITVEWARLESSEYEKMYFQTNMDPEYLELLSWADIFFIAYTECIDGLVETKSLDKYRHLNALKEKLYSVPNIKNWIQKRPDTR